MPYLFGYKGKGGTQPFGGTTRHWLIKGATPAANKEYMSNWWMTNPQPNQIGLTGLPQAAPYWTTLNQRLADYTWKTDARGGARGPDHQHGRHAVHPRR